MKLSSIILYKNITERKYISDLLLVSEHFQQKVEKRNYYTFNVFETPLIPDCLILKLLGMCARSKNPTPYSPSKLFTNRNTVLKINYNTKNVEFSKINPDIDRKYQ